MQSVICNKDGTGNHCVHQSYLGSRKQILHEMQLVVSKNDDPMDTERMMLATRSWESGWQKKMGG